MTYRIHRFNPTFGCQEYVLPDGSGWTLHLDKAASFETLTTAAYVQGQWFADAMVTFG